LRWVGGRRAWRLRLRRDSSSANVLPSVTKRAGERRTHEGAWQSTRQRRRRRWTTDAGRKRRPRRRVKARPARGPRRRAERYRARATAACLRRERRPRRKGGRRRGDAVRARRRRWARRRRLRRAVRAAAGRLRLYCCLCWRRRSRLGLDGHDRVPVREDGDEVGDEARQGAALRTDAQLQGQRFDLAESESKSRRAARRTSDLRSQLSRYGTPTLPLASTLRPLRTASVSLGTT